MNLHLSEKLDPRVYAIAETFATIIAEKAVGLKLQKVTFWNNTFRDGDACLCVDFTFDEFESILTPKWGEIMDDLYVHFNALSPDEQILYEEQLSFNRYGRWG